MFTFVNILVAKLIRTYVGVSCSISSGVIIDCVLCIMCCNIGDNVFRFVVVYSCTLCPLVIIREA